MFSWNCLKTLLIIFFKTGKFGLQGVWLLKQYTKYKNKKRYVNCSNNEQQKKHHSYMKTWIKRIYQNQNTLLYIHILWVYKIYISFKLISTVAYIVQGPTKLMILNFVVIIKMLKLINSKLTSWRFSVSLKSIRKADSSGMTPPPRPGDQSLCGTAETHRGAHPVTCKQPCIDHRLSAPQLCVVFSVCLAERVVAKATTEDVACLHMEVLTSAARKSFKASVQFVLS